MKNGFTLLLLLLVFRPSSAQPATRSHSLMISAGATAEYFMDKHIASLIWNGQGYCIATEYQQLLLEYYLICANVSYSSSTLVNNVTDDSIRSSDYSLKISGYRMIFAGKGSFFYSGLSMKPQWSVRKSDLPYHDVMHDGWITLAISNKLIHKSPKWLWQIDVNMLIVSAIVTQEYVNNNSYKIHTATIDKTFKVDTGIRLLYRTSPSSNLGLDYSWDYYNIRINKRIDRAMHLVKIMYCLDF